MGTASTLRKKFSQKDWYRQGAAVKPLYIGFPWETCYGFSVQKVRTGQWYRGIVVYLGDDYFDVYFPIKNLRLISRGYALRETKHPGFTRRWFDKWLRGEVRIFLQEIEKLKKTPLSDLSDEDLSGAFSHFAKVYSNLWREAIFLDAFDAAGDEMLLQELSGAGIAATADELHALTAMTEPTWLQREKRDLLKLVAKASRSPSLSRLIVRGKRASDLSQRYKDFCKALALHSHRYAWLMTDYATVRVLSPDHFLKDMRLLLKDPDKRAEEEKRILQPSRSASVRKRLVKKLRLPERARIFTDFLMLLALWRDHRKAYNQMAGEPLRRFAVEIARRNRVDVRDVEYLFWWEIESLLKHGKPGAQGARMRRAGSFFTDKFRPHKTGGILRGDEARSLHAILQRLVSSRPLIGRTAYAGLVRGMARIVLKQSDFKKMKKGDVLLAANTRPEYVPVMRLAGAIVTEEGGITSHAAIVSRELRKPCIVGAQGVLARIRDGEMVEVDAAAGTIKKIRT